jgi:hypothetical protein
MTDQPQSPANRRRFRFGLCTLVVVMALAAVGSWSYWIVWPWWQAYLEQTQFEASARTIKAGMSRSESERILPGKFVTGATDTHGKKISLTQFDWKSATCFIYCGYPDSTGPGSNLNIAFSSVEILRVPPIPNDYHPRTARMLALFAHPDENFAPISPRQYYFLDFLEFISDDRKNNYGLQYELIYSGPVAKSEGK